jgi:hypothetical protein
MGDQNHLAWRGTTIAKSLIAGMEILYESLRIQLASRSMGLYNEKNSQTCETYFALTSLDPTAIPIACAEQNFLDVDQLLVYVNGQMATDNTLYRDTIKAATGVSDTVLDEFYDKNTAGSFGNVLQAENEANATHFECVKTDLNGCTAYNLAALQWGSSAITSNPREPEVGAEKYMPQSQTYYGWSSESNWEIEGVTEPMEYAYYTNPGFWTADDTAEVGAPPMLTFDQVTKFSDAKYSWYGLSNQYNAMLLANCL